MPQYYFVLRSVLRTKPNLRPCLTRCRHCRIFFLTHPRNAARSDLRCPFGCKDAYRKRSSTQRSMEYYSTEEGKFKKSIQNSKRGNGRARPNIIQAETGPELVLHEYGFNAQMVCYLRMVTSLIEGRRVSVVEILEMLARAVRQHSMVRRRRIDYVLQYLSERAP